MPNTLKIKRGTNATIPQGQLAEPLFTTDTYDLYIGKGSGGNQRFQKYIASGTSSQFLKGDGTLDSTTYQATSEKGANNGYASLDSGGKVPASQLPNSIMDYLGTWNASTNTPTLADGTGNAGDVYIVSVGGTQNLGSGSITFAAGDWVVYSGSVWQKSINSNAVASVNGQTGAVVLTLNGLTNVTQTFATGTTGTDFTISSSGSIHTFNIPSASATSRGLLTSGDYNTFALKQSAITLTTTGTSGAATFVGATLNIPNYGSALSGYLPLTGGTLTGSLFGTTASFTSNTSNFTLGSQVDTAIYMHFGTKNASGGYGIGHRIAGTINATANFDNLHGLWVDYTDNVGAYVGVVKYAIFQPDSAKQNYFGGTTTFNSFIWAQSTIGIGVNSTAYDLYIRKTAAYAMIESYTNSATSQLYFKGNNASSIAVTGGIIYTPSTSGNHNISITPDTSTSLGMILNTNSAGFGVIPKATTYYSLQSDYGVLSGNLAANISSNSYYNSGWKFYGTGFATLYNQDPSTGKHEFFTSASGSSGGSVSFGTAKFSIAQSGAATFSGALSGTSATFSGNVVLGTTALSGGGAAQWLTANGTAYGGGLISSVSGVVKAYYYYDNTANAAMVQGIAGVGVQLWANNAVALSIASTGAATFSSSVAATSLALNGSIANSGDAATLTLKQSSTTYTNGIYLERGGERNGYYMYIGGSVDSLTFRRNYFGTQSDVMSLTRDGNVGIGTSSPTFKLEVKGGNFNQLLLDNAGEQYTALDFRNNGSTKTDFFYDNTNTAFNIRTRVAAPIIFSTNDSERMRITSGGNTILGNNAGSAWSTASGRTTLEIYGSNFPMALHNSLSVGNSITYNTYWDGTNWRYVGATYSVIYIQDGEGHKFLHNGAGTAGGSFTPSEKMRITSGGNVVIGATSSSHKLRVIEASASQGTVIFSADNALYNSIQVYAAGADGYNGAATVTIFGRNTSTSRSINAGGTINASGADYAEYMTKAITENIAKGDIVGIDANGLLTNIYADAISFVVKSTDPSYVGGDKWGADLTGVELETARQKVDRVAFSGQVPCNVLNAKVGDYIIPINVNGKIKGEAVTTPTFEQYQISVGKVWKIMEDGRAWIAIKIG